MPSFIDMLKINVSGTLNSAASFLMINIQGCQNFSAEVAVEIDKK